MSEKQETADAIIALLTQCRDLLAAINERTKPKEEPTGPKMLFKELAKAYLDYSRSKVKPSTLCTYENLLLASPFATSLANRDVSELSRAAVQLWIDSFDEHTSYIHNFVIVFRSMISWAREREICALPGEYSKPFKFKRIVRKGGGKEIEDGDFNKILQYTTDNLSKDRKYAAVFVAANTGMRIGEVCGLTSGDIDAENNIIHIQHTLKRIYSPVTKKTELQLGTPKSKTSTRNIPASENVIGACLLHRPKGHTLFDVEPRELTEFFKRLQERAGCERHHTFHSLRHTFVSREIRIGKNPKAVSAYVGHGSLDMTLGVYAHVSEKDLKEVANG